MKLYCLSGLGTDHRAFKNIHLNGVELVHIPWIKHHKDESLKAYAQRLFDHVQPENDYNLIGLSFGGMIAAEWESIKKPKNLFLLSTISDKSELGASTRFIGWLRLHRIIPMSILTKPNFISYYIFGVPKNENRKVFKEILKDTNFEHLKWAMSSILKWSNTKISSGLKIHGDKDKVTPYRNNADFLMKGAGHMAVLNNATEIQQYLKSKLF